MNYKNLTGKRFGRLTVIRESGRDNQGRCMWLCSCDCGVQKEVASRHLTQGRTLSCGCWSKEKASTQFKTHGLTKNHKSLLCVWYAMCDRCYNPDNKGYKNYGGRGITVCDNWCDDFVAFCAWALSHGYKKGLSLDRIDNNGDYSPDNCQWLTVSENTKKAWRDRKAALANKRLGDFGL